MAPSDCPSCWAERDVDGTLTWTSSPPTSGVRLERATGPEESGGSGNSMESPSDSRGSVGLEGFSGAGHSEDAAHTSDTCAHPIISDICSQPVIGGG